MSNTPNTNSCRVLIIDDDRGDAALAAASLSVPGPVSFSVRHVENLEDSYEAIETEAFDIVLLDLGLPGSSGLEALDSFRAKNESTPVIVLSGLEDELVAIQALERNAQEYLCKNEVNPRNLLRAIRHSIQRQSSLNHIRNLLITMQEKEETLQRKNEHLQKLYDTAHTFVDNVSHEFRTPLTVIKEYIALVQDGTMGSVNDEQKRFLEIAADRVNDLNTMVDDMLDVSKLEAGLLSIRRKPQRLCDIVNRIHTSLKHKAEVRELELELNTPEDLPLVFCDGEKIQRVMINLIVNAIKFTPPGGRVEVSAYQSGNDVAVRVSDNGPGIPDDKLQAIFDRFEQVDSGMSSSTKGFGLGLNIAKELVSLNLGRLTVDSEIGSGSHFTFTVPVFEPSYVMQRYLQRLTMTGRDKLSLITVTLASDESQEACNDFDTFIAGIIKGRDLMLHTTQNEWQVLIPEPDFEAQHFVNRAERELQMANRNRPAGPLPEADFEIRRTWTENFDNEVELIREINALTSNAKVAVVS